MKRTIPLLITALGGFMLIVSSFIPAFQRAGEEVTIWFNILAAIAFILGGANLFRLQLQRISDRKPGWGFAVVTLVSFVATLFFGLFKIGSAPEESVEAYGETAISFPVTSVPVFSIPLTVPPVRGDGEPLPRSVRRQISITHTPSGDELTFAGWMRPQQRGDLTDYQDTLAWKCQIERLAELASPPPSLAGKVQYNINHQSLFFVGPMSDEDRTALIQALPPSPETTRTIDQLHAASNQITSKTFTGVPAGFAIPESQQHLVQQTDGPTPDSKVLTLRGPMSIPMRRNLVMVWSHFPRVRPLLPVQQSELLVELENHGPPLTPQQRATFENVFAGVWEAETLIQQLNSAGISAPEPKSFCELLAEIEAGNPNPELASPPPEPVELNDSQKGVIERFMVTPEMTFEMLQTELTTAGELSPAQSAALQQFITELPTQADQRKELCFRLLDDGPLSQEQTTFLLEDSRRQFHWQQQVGEMFLAAHQVKYPWSGHYSSPGGPFTWLFEYVLEPLMTTTFAVLAFYVASAAFRAFRAKNLEAILLLGTAFIILLGRTSAGVVLTGWIPDSYSAFRLDQMTVYIMSIFNTAGSRAIMIGIALGTISTSLKALLGVDRSYLGRDD